MERAKQGLGIAVRPGCKIGIGKTHRWVSKYRYPEKYIDLDTSI
jgi:hypothetical protein